MIEVIVQWVTQLDFFNPVYILQIQKFSYSHILEYKYTFAVDFSIKMWPLWSSDTFVVLDLLNFSGGSKPLLNIPVSGLLKFWFFLCHY